MLFHEFYVSKKISQRSTEIIEATKIKVFNNFVVCSRNTGYRIELISFFFFFINVGYKVKKIPKISTGWFFAKTARAPFFFWFLWKKHHYVRNSTSIFQSFHTRLRNKLLEMPTKKRRFASWRLWNFTTSPQIISIVRVAIASRAVLRVIIRCELARKRGAPRVQKARHDRTQDSCYLLIINGKYNLESLGRAIESRRRRAREYKDAFALLPATYRR